MCDTTVRFSVLCSMLDAVARNKKPAMKRKCLRTFLDHVYTDHEFFSALRLILPGLDKERGTYGLKEAALARSLSDALGLAKESEDAKRLLNWKTSGGAHSGNFPLVAAEVLFRRQSTASGGLSIKDVNDYLDRLASAEGRDDKTAVLAELINKTNVQEMKWIIIIILKELKLGISEKTVLHEFHPDAEDLFNVTCDLKLVCEKLKDRSQRYKRQDIEVGKPVRPQLASRVADVEEAWRKLRGKRIVAECKFDGDRIQIHKNGNDVHFFSRSFIDHKEYTDGLTAIIIKQVKIEKCILDGEMLVWNKHSNSFAEFGSNQEVAKAAKEGLKTDQQLCYVAFDILYSGDSSVTHRGLQERQLLLKQVVQPLKGSLELLIPGTGGGPDKPCWSMEVQSAEEINKFFLDTVENRDEGIVLKDLDSKWEPGDRGGKWIKLKPDYIHAESDLDALIIGCYLGSGRRGGEIGQFLLGVSERPKQGGHPTRFLSFCKVGSGLSDNERDVLVSKLKPYLRRYDRNTKPPSYYTVTNNSKERPDFWVEQPEKSVILEITSDIRTIKSDVFAAPYSLRFPRTRRVRYDKPWYDCLAVESLVELVHSRGGNIAESKDHGKPNRARVAKPRKNIQSLPLVPSHMLMTDVSNVKKETSIFKGLVFHFINVQPQSFRDSLHKMVAENGGSFSMNLNDSVTHAIAAEKKGLRYQAAALSRDIIHQSWVTSCCSQKALLPLSPKYVLHLLEGSKIKVLEDMDDFSDGYFRDIDEADLKQLFENVDGLGLCVSKETVCHFEQKYCQREGFGQFCGCTIYFHEPIHSSNLDSQMVADIALRRLKLEVVMCEGEVASKLKGATHMIVYSSSEHHVSFSNILRSVTNEEKNILMAEKVHIVKHTWLEAAVTSKSKPAEDDFSLRAPIEINQECILASENALNKGLVVCHGAKLRKRGRSSVVRESLSSEGDEVTPRRRLYALEGPKLEKTLKDSLEDNHVEAGRIAEVAKEDVGSSMGKVVGNSQEGEGGNAAHASTSAGDIRSRSSLGTRATGKRKVQNCAGSNEGTIKTTRSTKKSRSTMKGSSGKVVNRGLSLSSPGNENSETLPEVTKHDLESKVDDTPMPEGDANMEGIQVASTPVKKETLSLKNTKDGSSENVREATAGKKKKVSYKDLVGRFLDQQ